MAFLLMARIVALIHFGFVVFLFFGSWMLGARWWIPWTHGPCVLYGVFITASGWTCPLTWAERSLIAAAGEQPYPGEFLHYYFRSHFGLIGTEVPVAAGMVVALIAANYRSYRTLLTAR